MATENEKGWNGLRQETIREEMRNSMGIFLLCLFFSPLAFCTLSRPGRLVGRRALESEAAFGFEFPFPFLGFSSSACIPRLQKQGATMEPTDSCKGRIPDARRKLSTGVELQSFIQQPTGSRGWASGAVIEGLSL